MLLPYLGSKVDTVRSQNIQIFSGRVLYTIYGEEDKEIFDSYGKWASIGGILFESVLKPDDNNTLQGKPLALPLLPNIKQPPVKGEIVTILILSDRDAGRDTNQHSYYYLTPTNAWNSINTNRVPVEVFNERKDSSDILDLPYARNLKLQPGDITYESRWGGSIRFSSTNSTGQLPWSKTGKEGDSIITIVNQVVDTKKDPWIPTVENINTDLCSIYLTSSQIINIDTKYFKPFKSFRENNSPIDPSKYNEPQIIINSGRVVVNSNKDGIIIGGRRFINLNTPYVGIDANEVIIDTSSLKLGSRKAEQSVIKGDLFLNDLENLIASIDQLGKTLQNLITPPTGSPFPTLNLIGLQLEKQSKTLLKNLENYKSKTVKII